MVVLAWLQPALTLSHAQRAAVNLNATVSQVRDVLEAHFELQPPRKANVNVAATPGEPAEQLASTVKDR